MDKERAFRVLIADDNRHIRSIVEQALERLDPGKASFWFVKATGGDEVIEVLAHEDLDLAILDVYMPVVDGVRLVERIRSTRATETLPVLVVSSGGPDAEKAALAAGADRFLAKPLRLVDVQDAVRTLLKL